MCVCQLVSYVLFFLRGTNVFTCAGETNIFRHKEGTNNFILRGGDRPFFYFKGGGQTLYIGSGGGYDDVDVDEEEMDISESVANILMSEGSKL